jgi:hypothetical protein
MTGAPRGTRTRACRRGNRTIAPRCNPVNSYWLSSRSCYT